MERKVTDTITITAEQNNIYKAELLHRIENGSCRNTWSRLSNENKERAFRIMMRRYIICRETEIPFMPIMAEVIGDAARGVFVENTSSMELL